jgi:lincosamide nucleotidyltransferase A/C/D/E
VWGSVGVERLDHGDVDLVVELAALDAVFDALAMLGFGVVEDYRPTRIVLRAVDGRQVDLHPITFDAEGTGWQAGAAPNGGDCAYPAPELVMGEIAGRAVRCISAGLQLAHHGGYEPRPVDRQDMARLSDRFELDLPDSY